MILTCYCSKCVIISIISVTLTDMVTVDEKQVIITMQSDDSKKTLRELRKAIVTVTTVLVESDEWNYHPDLPESVSTMIRLLDNLVQDD